MKFRKALVVGINDYPGEGNKLKSCVNDANSIAKLLGRNYDDEVNFGVVELVDAQATRSNIIAHLKKVFDDETDTGIFYFSGHGFDDADDGQLVTYDCNEQYFGIKFKEVNEILRKSKCRNKIVIIDACYSGKVGNFHDIGDITYLSKGTTILTSCNEKETAIEKGNHGLFTNLLIYALEGGASDIFGRITPASIYSYIDSCLGEFEQRPLFKSYVSTFVTLREVAPKITKQEVKTIARLFADYRDKYQLNPSYEPTNYVGSKKIGKKDLKEPYCTPEHTKIFALLQKAVQNGLIKPTNERHMFYAAMNSDTCELTDLGIQYWILVNKGLI